MTEPRFCVTFGQYAAERLRACPEPLQARLRSEAGMSAAEHISDVKAAFMLETCASLRGTPLRAVGADDANLRANQCEGTRAGRKPAARPQTSNRPAPLILGCSTC